MASAPTSPQTASSPPKPSRLHRILIESLWLLAASLGALAVAVWLYSLWNMSLHTPMATGSGDGLAAASIVRSVLDHGWLGHNPDIGAPYGSSMQDLVVSYGYATQLMIAKFLAFVGFDVVAIMNLLFVLGYPLMAATAYLVLRDLRFSRIISLVAAILFATTHYHFVRAGGHVFLGLAYSVPLACWLLYGFFGRVRLFERRAEPGPRLLQWVTLRSMLTVLAAVIVGISEIYYAVFALVIGAVVVVLVVAQSGTLRRAITPVLVLFVIAGSALTAQLPGIIFHAKNGPTTVSARAPGESEVYGLKIADLLLPMKYHRIDALDDLNRMYSDRTPVPGEGQSSAIGGFATIGLLLALLAAAGTALGKRGTVSRNRQLAQDSGLLALVAILIGTVGGGSALIAYLLDPQIRGWNRISIFIAFFAIVAVAATLTWISKRLAGRGPRAAKLATPVVVVLGMVGVWEQTYPYPLPYEGLVRAWQNDTRFVDQIEAKVPPKSQILQLPYAPFPEGGMINTMPDYDHFRAYMASDDLQWSFGASKGRLPEDWAAAAASLPTNQLVKRAAAAGFEGIYVNRAGYADDGAAIVGELAKATGVQPIASLDGKLLFFDLQPKVADLKATTPPAELAEDAESLLEPAASIAFGPGFYLPEQDAANTWHWAAPQSTLLLNNASGEDKPATLDLSFVTPGQKPSRVKVTFPDGTSRTVTVQPNTPLPFKQPLTVPQGDSKITFSTNAPDDGSDPRDLHLRVNNVLLKN